MFQLKPITSTGVPAALRKAERYRLINDPSCAESICLDVLALEPNNQDALITLILAITDQCATAPAAGQKRALALLPRLGDACTRAYYEGIICERRAKAHLAGGTPGGAQMAYDWFRSAMTHYERAEQMAPPGDDEAILRWNTCARILDGDEHHLRPHAEPEYEPSFE